MSQVFTERERGTLGDLELLCNEAVQSRGGDLVSTRVVFANRKETVRLVVQYYQQSTARNTAAILVPYN